MTQFNRQQPDSSPTQSRLFNRGGSASAQEIREAEQNWTAVLLARACQEFTAGVATEDRQDISQDATLELLERLRKGHVLRDEQMRGYAWFVTQSAHLKIERKERRRVIRETRAERLRQRETSAWEDPTHGAEAHLIQRKYEKVAAMMPVACRSAFEEIKLRGLTFAELLERTGLSQNALRKRVETAQDFLKAYFEQERADHRAGAAHDILQ